MSLNDQRSVEVAILAVLDSYAQSVFEKDVDAFMRLYEQDASVFDAWDAWQHEGADAWRNVVTEWFTSLGEERIRVTFEQVRVRAGVGAAGVSCFVRYSAVNRQGAELRSMKNRVTWLLLADGERWLISHEHSSVPVKFGQKTAVGAP